LITEIFGKRLSLFTPSNVQKDETFIWTSWGPDEKKQGCSQKRTSRKKYILI